MSRSVDLFIDADLPLDDLAVELGQRLGAEATPEPDEPGWRLELGAVTARLGPHPYVDDGDLLLSRYRYVLSARVTGAEALNDAPEAAALREASQLLRRDTTWRVLLVLDLHYRDPGPGRHRGDDPPAGTGSGSGAGASGEVPEARR